MSDTQFVATDGVIDLTWGHPDPALLPVDAVAEASLRVVRSHGPEALAYGAPAGPMSLRSAIAAHLSAGGDGPVEPAEVLVTAGASGGLDLLMSMYARRGDVVFVEQPTYFLALKILSDHDVTVVGLTADREGTDPGDLVRHAAAIRDRHPDRRLFLYCIPTFANPTGRSLSADRRLELLAAAAAAEVTVIEDDVYRDTASTAPQSMWSLARATGLDGRRPMQVFRLGSFSKTLAPGLRVGFVTTDQATVDRIAECGLLDSGGGVTHFAAMVVADLVESGRYATIAAGVAERLSARRRALSASIDQQVLPHHVPDGGYFLWLRVPDGHRSVDVVTAARANGVLVADGRPFFTATPTGHLIRASYSMLDESSLRAAGEILTETVRSMLR